MPESDRQNRARTMIENVEAMLLLADQDEDFLIAAKLADVRAVLAERYIADDR